MSESTLKRFECTVTGTQLPLYILWYLNETLYRITYCEFFNDNGTTAISLLHVPLKGRTKVTCVANGTFINTQPISLVTSGKGKWHPGLRYSLHGVVNIFIQEEFKETTNVENSLTHSTLLSFVHPVNYENDMSLKLLLQSFQI